MWPPDLGPPGVQLTLPAFGAVFEEAEDLHDPLSSGGLRQSSKHSGGLGVCCLPRSSLSLSSLGRDLTTLLSCKPTGSHVEKSAEDFAVSVHSDCKNNGQRFSCYAPPSLPLSYMLSSCSTTSPYGPSQSSTSSSSLFFPPSAPDSPGDNKCAQQQLHGKMGCHAVKEEPADDFLACKSEPFPSGSQQGEQFQVGQPLQGLDGQDEGPRSFQKLGGEPVGHERRDQLCHWINCNATYSCQEELVRHIEKVHIDQRKGEEFSCFWAGCVRRHKPFNARYKLLIHMRVHSGEKPNKCMVSPPQLPVLTANQSFGSLYGPRTSRKMPLVVNEVRFIRKTLEAIFF